MKLRGAWLRAFWAFLVLAVASIWREVPGCLLPRPEAPGTLILSLVPESAAVLPFDDVLVASPYAISDKKTPSERPEAVRREPDGSLAWKWRRPWTISGAWMGYHLGLGGVGPLAAKNCRDASVVGSQSMLVA